MVSPDSPSPLRRAVLAPAALLYAAGASLHRRLWLRPRVFPRDHLIPLIVVGALRAGGSGKTPVALEIARHLAASGKRVGLLAYRIAGGKHATLEEVSPASDWRESSDEAVWLARHATEFGARVFATRDRERAWDSLSRSGEFDVLVSDDGWMDARLQGAYRIVLKDADEAPGWSDLLPAGSYRRTAAALKEADEVVIWGGGPGRGAVRSLSLPRGIDPEKPHWVVCGIGNPHAFLRSLKAAGICVAGCSVGPDHGLPNLRRARHKAASSGTDRFLCTEKDFVKLERRPDVPPGLRCVTERLDLDTALFSRLEAWLESRLATPSS